MQAVYKKALLKKKRIGWRGGGGGEKRKLQKHVKYHQSNSISRLNPLVPGKGKNIVLQKVVPPQLTVNARKT